MIVDDVELNRAILSELFQKEYSILEAENGAEALELLEQKRRPHQGNAVRLGDAGNGWLSGVEPVEK